MTESDAKQAAQGDVKGLLPSISLPKGGGAIRGIGEKFAPNAITGTGSLSVPVFCSPGRSGFGPSLALSYDTGSGNSSFGFGWSLDLPRVTRKTDKGLPQYRRDTQESDTFILSGAEDLMPTLLLVGSAYTGVNATLTLQSSSIRTSTDVTGNKYTRQGPDDVRFNDYYGTVQSIVASSAQADNGLFENNLHDERYLPFEALGAAGSQWQLSLPSDLPQFDFDTITDVILHVRYTAREGGDALKNAAVNNLRTLIAGGQTIGSVCLFSIRHEFPSQWAKFQSTTIAAATPSAQLQLTLIPELYPYWSRDTVSNKPLKAVEFFAEVATPGGLGVININDNAALTGKNDTLVVNPALGGLLSGNLSKIALPAAISDATHPPLTLFFDNNAMSDLWLAITWGK